jgi:hypothetical protein
MGTAGRGGNTTQPAPPPLRSLRVRCHCRDHHRGHQHQATQQQRSRRAAMMMLSIPALLGWHTPPASAASSATLVSPLNRLTFLDVQADYDGYAATYDGLDGSGASDAVGFTALRRQLIAKASLLNNFLLCFRSRVCVVSLLTRIRQGKVQQLLLMAMQSCRFCSSAAVPDFCVAGVCITMLAAHHSFIDVPCSLLGVHPLPCYNS